MTMTQRPVTAGRRRLGRARRWYATAAATEERMTEDGIVLWPTSVAHAKEAGTTHTACGLWTYSWRTMMDLPFPLRRGRTQAAMCPACLLLVKEGGR
ncbi:hypothetical protein [Nocardioides sambongensis]|uniref:hypothetical protein n=1 Tax=Nocardioides sambongensis TaxID=2589074 RepID=UPI001127D8E2|nr:hypothetical protein [Nocardioides sambongensis]